MCEFECIKQIPHLCNVGEKGTIVPETFSTYIDLHDEFHPKGWGFYKTIRKTVLKFSFNTTFFENHVTHTLGKPIYLNQHFKKI